MKDTFIKRTVSYLSIQAAITLLFTAWKSVRIQELTDQKNLRIWTLFTQWSGNKLLLYKWLAETN